MSVRVSPISRLASLLIMLIGVITMTVGWSTGNMEDTIGGIAFIILGIVLNRLLYGFERKA
jgi:hypothetical protein